MRVGSQPGQESIPIPIPTPTPIQTMIGRIGNHCLEAAPEGARLFGRALARRSGLWVGLRKLFADDRGARSEVRLVSSNQDVLVMALGALGGVGHDVPVGLVGHFGLGPTGTSGTPQVTQHACLATGRGPVAKVGDPRCGFGHPA